MKTEELKEKPIRVAGHLEINRNNYHMILSWKDYDGKRVRKSKTTGLTVKGNKKRAEDMLIIARKEQEKILNNKPKTSELLFADFMEQWLNSMRNDVRITTFGGYESNVNRVIVPYFKKKGTLLCDLTANDINDFYSEKLERVKATTVHKYHANISKALKYAMEKNLIKYSVMDKVKRPKASRFTGNFLRESEVIELFAAVEGHKLELGVLLGAFYGLRRAEIVGLRWESINFEANTITIEHTVTTARVNGKSVVVADDVEKSKSSHRTLPLITVFREKLLAVKAEQEQNRKLCGRSYNKEHRHYIYTDAMGNRINPNYLSDEFPVFLERNNFRRIRFHDLRHSCASLLLANGVPLKQIQEWLGHSDFEITANTYAHLDFKSKLASADAMQWVYRTVQGK